MEDGGYKGQFLKSIPDNDRYFAEMLPPHPNDRKFNLYEYGL